MSITTKLTDKLEKEIRDFCRLNGLQLGEYVAKCIEKQFNLDRYGDLNERFLPIEIPKKDEPVIRIPPSEEEITIVKGEPDIGTIIAEEKVNINLDKELVESPSFGEIEEAVVNGYERLTNEPQKKKKRVRTIESK